MPKKKATKRKSKEPSRASIKKTRLGRKLESSAVRNRAKQYARKRKHPNHETNGEENDKKLARFTNFRKGLPHEDNGLLKNPSDYDDFAEACEDQELAGFSKVPIGTKIDSFRKWESPTAGAIYELEGADAQAVTMPPAPKIDSPELALEMAEVYLMALLRDVEFSDFATHKKVAEASKALETFRKKKKIKNRIPITPQSLFRGEGNGVTQGPLISQFLLVGTPDIVTKQAATPAGGINSDPNGKIEYGAQLIDQRVRTAKAGKDFMQCLPDWVEVQRGTDIPNIQGGAFEPNEARRFIATARDIATYVHFDALYQAYLNACLILLASGAAFQPGLPHQSARKLKTKGFAQFGGPHILTLVTEVATRALKAVRHQKFTSHRRGRPEQLAGLVSQYKSNAGAEFDPIAPLSNHLDEIKYKGHPLLDSVKDFNKSKGGGYFLPMAFPEGSPMHPSYGAGHATVAGACVTVLKAFFKTDVPIEKVYVPVKGGEKLRAISKPPKLTIEGELNKLAANISVGRNMAGVHYYTDYSKSLEMGEEIAISILEEQLFTYPEKVKMVVPRFFSNTKTTIENF